MVSVGLCTVSPLFYDRRSRSQGSRIFDYASSGSF